MNEKNDYSKYSASQSEIQEHYDVGNDFFKLWLDSGMNYSCALWDTTDKNDNLENAQKRKIQFHINASKAKGKAHILEIGCGWGAMLETLVQSNEVKKVVGLTLSQAQSDYIQKNMINNIRVYVEAWQNHVPQQLYDAIISIGAFEHFARPSLNAEEKIAVYRSFFSKCHEWLESKGRVSLQTIAYGCVDEVKRKKADDYEKFAFPGSTLPRLQEIIIAAEDIFNIIHLQNDAEHYQRTCQSWYTKLREKRQEAKRINEDTYKHFNIYLKFSEAAFRVGNLALYRIIFEKPK